MRMLEASPEANSKIVDQQTNGAFHYVVYLKLAYAWALSNSFALTFPFLVSKTIPLSFWGCLNQPFVLKFLVCFRKATAISSETSCPLCNANILYAFSVPLFVLIVQFLAWWEFLIGAQRVVVKFQGFEFFYLGARLSCLEEQKITALYKHQLVKVEKVFHCLIPKILPRFIYVLCTRNSETQIVKYQHWHQQYGYEIRVHLWNGRFNNVRHQCRTINLLLDLCSSRNFRLDWSDDIFGLQKLAISLAEALYNYLPMCSV